MDNSYITTATQGDMQSVLEVFGEFVDWARFRVKSAKSRALVLKVGKVVEWEEAGGVVGRQVLSFGGEVIPNVAEKPIKFLGRWIRADVRDSLVIEETGKQLKLWMNRLDESGLSGLEKY